MTTLGTAAQVRAKSDVSHDTIPVVLIDPDPEQPRQHFDPAKQAELAKSIAANGLASPILVRPVNGRFVIVHGERRYRAVASASLGWDTIAAVVRDDLDDSAARWMQLAENINREDLSPIEEARSYQRLINCGITHADIAHRLGKTRTYITQKLRLLGMPAALVTLVDCGALSEGHARQLMRIKSMYTDAHTLGRADDGIDYANWALPWTEPDGKRLSDEARADLAFSLLIACRPVDWPPGYPFMPKSPVVADAAEAMCREIAGQRHAYPRWALPAFYYAALAVAAKVSVADLAKLIDAWIEQVKSAILYTRILHPEPPQWKGSPDTSPLSAWMVLAWRGYRSDLRHAGLLDNGHLSFEAVSECINQGTIAIPSEFGFNGPRHTEYIERYAFAYEEES